MGGYMGKILRVNLSSKEISVEDLDMDIASSFIGGRGYGAKILFDELPVGIDPLSPENKLIFMTGPLTGTAAPTSGRYSVSTKSPATGTVFDANSGGHFGVELKRAGFDGIIFEGASETPVYLSVMNGKAELRDASNLWGLDVFETESRLKQIVNDSFARVACIGPAGERLVKIAAIMNEKHRTAARGGVGAVMGSKKLKAIVVRGSSEIPLANRYAFMKEVKHSIEVIKGHPITGDGLGRYGTAVLVHIINKAGIFPVRNYSTGVFEDAEKVSGEYMAKTILKGKKGCFACPIMCGRVTKVKLPSGEIVESEGPEYETIWSLGPNCGINDIEAIAYANDLCNRYGIDTISMGQTIGFLMACFENGKVKPEDIGFAPKFGNTEALQKLITMTAFRQGIGDILAEGTKRAAAKLGGEEYAMHVKGLELPAYDPRGAKGMALAYATSNRGGCHLRAFMIAPEILSVPRYLNPNAYDNKAALTKVMQDVFAVLDSLVLCKYTTLALFSTLLFEPDFYARLLTTATGFYVDREEFYKIGERIYNLERLFNVREGFCRKDDYLPRRLLEVPMPEGPAKGETVDMDRLLNEYYAVRGWDYNGIPTDKKVSQLGLKPLYEGPKLQVAVDERYLKDALPIAEASYRGGADIIEAGTPLIKSEGLRAVKELRRICPNATIIADLKTFDTGWLETELAVENGADIVTVMGATDDYTIKDAVGAARKYGVKVMVDLMNLKDPISRAVEVEKLGVDIVCMHVGISAQTREREVDQKIALVENLVKSVKIPVAVAGGIKLEVVPLMVNAGAKILIVGGAITKSANPEEATRRFVNLIRTTWNQRNVGTKAQ
ncbi:MAG: 3-hexulose-6-phosphate synthase [Candidatus Methanomethylicaceae archaeon]